MHSAHSHSAVAFGLRSLVLYVLLVFPWPGAVELYSSVFRGIANATCSDAFSGARVRFDPMQTPAGTLNTELTLLNRSNQAFVRKNITPWRTGYLPTATTIALLLALPIPFRRRCTLLIGAVIAVHGFIVARVFILVANGLNEPTPAATLSLGPAASRMLTNANSIFVETTTVTFVIPAIIWLAITIASGTWPFAAASESTRQISRS